LSPWLQGKARRPRGLELYKINNNQFTAAAFIGTIGLEWQYAGIAPVHAETVMTESPSPLTMLLSRHTKRREAGMRAPR
jgi:hypothetical protein